MPCSTDPRRDRGLIAAGTAREARDGRLVAVAAAPEHGASIAGSGSRYVG